MAITVSKYYKFLELQMNGSVGVDFETGVINVSLHTVTEAPDQTNDDFWDDPSTTNEVSGTNYTTRGALIPNPTITGGVTTAFDGDDVTWSFNAGGFNDARIGIIYELVGSEATDPLISWIDFGVSVGNDVADLVLVWNGAGIITWT